MRQLLLLRHAKSSWDAPGVPDHARSLNARGRGAAVAMARAMRDLGLMPDVVFVSSSRRTLQTLEAMTPFDDPALIEPMDALYLASWQRLLEVVRGTPETARSLLLIGHNPGMHELALALAGAAGIAVAGGSSAGAQGGAQGPGGVAAQAATRLAAAYPTGTLAEFAIALPWHLLEPGGARLVRYLTPRDLPGGYEPE